jgi:hypothetical protein
MLTAEPVARDTYGEWTHPALLDLFARGGEEREQVPADEWNAWKADHGIETDFNFMESELDPDHPACIRYFEEGDPVFVGWEPESPGEEWHLLSIHDTEDGPVAVWYRATTVVEAAT